jgi:hypothetical protein
MLKRILLSATVLACPLPAMADLITGELWVFPQTEFEQTGPGIDGIEIGLYTGMTLPTIATGSFAGLITPNSILIPQNVNTDIALMQLGHGSDLFCGQNCLYVIRLTMASNDFAWLNADTIHFDGVLPVGPPAYAFSGMGTMTLPGFDPTPGTFQLNFQGPGDYGNWNAWTSIEWHSDVPYPVPAPILGAGIVPFLMGLAGLSWLRRRRRVEATAALAEAEV